MKRRAFLTKTAATGALLSLAGIQAPAVLKKSKKHITILHTNDVHSHIEPFSPNDQRNANRGGVSRRYEIIKNVRNENPHTLLLDAGDIFQGTPYFNFYGGELEFKLMSKLGYDAATLGNHDFDNGIEGLFAQTPHANFELLSANYDFSNTLMDGLVKPYRVFVKDGVRIGVFGIGIQLSGLVNKKQYKETQYLDPVEIAQDMTQVLKRDERCDLIICLSHLGYQYEHDKISDIKLAQNTQDIDLIIGGHTHTFLDKPTIVQNKKEAFVLVNQVGWAGLQLGRIDFYLDDDRASSNNGVIYDI